mgnify:FL=1
MNSKIIYTKTDEAPMLATHSLLPIVKSFVSKANVEIELKDISLAGRILASFSHCLDEQQKVDDALTELGLLVLNPKANIIKLPNISASVPQLVAAIEELQAKGFDIPSYVERPETDEEKENQAIYNKIKGSAVNPILREGNSDRRAPKAVKNYAKVNPHSMGEWKADSKTHVATMKVGDFHNNEKSICVSKNSTVEIQHHADNGDITVLKSEINLEANEIIDAAFMSKKALLKFIHQEIKDAKENDVLFSLHMKATMMKVSDPIIFGYVVDAYFEEIITKYGDKLNELGVDFRNGFGDLIDKIQTLSKELQNNILSDISAVFKSNAELAMVDSDNGITNLHVPSDVIIDASMPAMIRNSGKMWDKDGNVQDTKAVIPDSSYASIYSATIEFCKNNGAFDPTTMGTVPNVGLMAKKAEEYGSHDKTFEILSKGKVKVIDSNGNTLIQHDVEKGDIWRMCQTKDNPVKDWVKLAVNRAKATNWPAIFWLNKDRAHDNELIKKVNFYLKDYDTSKIDIQILSPYQATLYTLERVKAGKNTISVTGNVLRDYLTDLFPILELGTSAKMLSIVPLMNGGGLFETGAGGSAPKHVQQFLKEGHLRWDSLGEFLAIVVSLEHLSQTNNNPKAEVLANCLDSAIEKLLKNGKSPKRKIGELDNRGSHFYLAFYWAEELANQYDDQYLQSNFEMISKKLKAKENDIVSELSTGNIGLTNISGYYYPNSDEITKYMRPSSSFNAIIDSI